MCARRHCCVKRTNSAAHGNSGGEQARQADDSLGNLTGTELWNEGNAKVRVEAVRREGNPRGQNGGSSGEGTDRGGGGGSDKACEDHGANEAAKKRQRGEKEEGSLAMQAPPKSCPVQHALLESREPPLEVVTKPRDRNPSKIAGTSEFTGEGTTDDCGSRGDDEK